MHNDTKCVQSGYSPKNGEPRVTPIVQSTTYKYDDAQSMGRLFDLVDDGFFYTRLGNPTCSVAENKIADLEGGVGALLTSSGQSASEIAIFNICGAGDHIISTSTIYGGTLNLLGVTMKKLGIEVTFVDPSISFDDLCKEFKPNTKLVFGETLSNPSLRVLDVEMFAKAAHDHDLPLFIDNTFPTPINLRPIEFGADIVLHSTSKYMDGHAVSLGGVIVDSGNFNWANGKFPEFTTPDDSYHGVVYTKQFGKAAFISKARVQMMRDLGPMAAPQNAFLLTLGLETLHLRMERHNSNALACAKYLEQHDKVAWVNYPGLKSSPDYKLAEKYLPGGCSGVISFGVKGGKEAAMTFMNNLKMAAIVCHVADLRTSVLHPASTTHRQLTEDQLKSCGVLPEQIRFSVGIENIDDIISDIEQAFEALK
ncbi:MAG: O-acetylhomoserine aminocarboxypropyltransferase/cysteine synthase [Bacillota bacterium]|nr:O-acetylhomoserine aminocarboxypropyltransferase/cysteine synthase [Bacillota bacterium]